MTTDFVTTERTVNGTESDTPMEALPKSYAEATLESIKAARESGRRAIEHYEAQLADLTTDYQTRWNEIQAHLRALRAECEAPKPRVVVKERVGVKKVAAPAKKPSPVAGGGKVAHPTRATGSKPGLVLADRIAELLTQHQGGPMTLGLIAQKLGETNAAVNWAVRSRPAVFAIERNTAGLLAASFLTAES